jgi:preprotein translocase subunit SecG
MQIIKYILVALYILDCLALIIITTMQNKDSRGASGTIVGSSTTNNFYEKNKSRTHEGKLKKWTIIFGVVFIVLALALGIVYVM